MAKLIKCLGILLGAGALLAALRHPPLAGLIIAAALGTVGMGACSQVCASLFREEGGRLRLIMQQQTLRCWLLGILLLVAQVWALASLPGRGLQAIAFILFDLYCLARTCGVVARWVGSEICPDERWQPAVGGLLLGLSTAAPVLGWVLAPQLLLVSLGAAVCPRRWSCA